MKAKSLFILLLLTNVEATTAKRRDISHYNNINDPRNSIYHTDKKYDPRWGALVSRPSSKESRSYMRNLENSQVQNGGSLYGEPLVRERGL